MTKCSDLSNNALKRMCDAKGIDRSDLKREDLITRCCGAPSDKVPVVRERDEPTVGAGCSLGNPAQLYIVQTVRGREESVARDLRARNLTVLVPVDPSQKGYIYIDASRDVVLDTIGKVRGAKKMLDSPVPFMSVENLLFERDPMEGLDTGDIVLVESGVLEGRKAKITQLNPRDKKITVIVLEAAYPIEWEIPASCVGVVEEESRPFQIF